MRCHVPGLLSEHEVLVSEGFDIVGELRDVGTVAFVKGRSLCLGTPHNGERRQVVNCSELSDGSFTWSNRPDTLYLNDEQILAVDVPQANTHPVTAFPRPIELVARSALTCTSNGQTLLFLDGPRSLRELEQPPSICRINTDGTGFRIILDRLDGPVVYSIGPSPDRNLLLVRCVGGPLWTIDREGNVLARLGDLPLDADDPVLSPSGDRAAYSDRRGIHVLHLGDGSSDLVCHFGRCASWSPDERTIAFMNDDNEAWVLDLNTKQASRILAIPVPNDSRGRRCWTWARPPTWSRKGDVLCAELTHSRRHDEPINADYAQALMKTTFGEIPVQQREEAVMLSLEQNHWEERTLTVFVDLTDHKIRLMNEQWLHASWAPISEADQPSV